jgi:HEAT repeat protein
MPGDLLFTFGLPLTIGAIAGLGTALVDRRVGRARVQRWRSVAERLGLREVVSDVPVFGKPWLSARSGRRRVRFERVKLNKSHTVTYVTVEGSTGITLVPEDPTGLTRVGGDREIELGDETFDAAVEVHGVPERVRAMLDAETRGIVLRMLNGRLAVPGQPVVTFGGKVTLVDGDLRATFNELPTAPTPRELADVLAAMLALAERFQGTRDVARQLAQSIETEPLWPVRLQGLQLLSTGFPNDPATIDALRHALTDDQPEVQLHAALALGVEGEERLLEIARRERVEDGISAQAIDALGEGLPADVGVSVLRQALRMRRMETGAACIHALGRLGGAEVEDLLIKVLSLEIGPLAVAAAQALGKTPSAEVEEALLRALARDVPELTLPLIEALGHTGSARAVLPIRDAGAGLGSDVDVRRAARQAVAEIQSRLQGASPGQLSIAEGEAGHLSLADDDPRGRVSLPEGR